MSAADAGTGDRPAVILLSGGLDSATLLAVARREGYRRYALTSVTVSATRWSWLRVVFGGSASTAEMRVPHHDRMDDSVRAFL